MEAKTALQVMLGAALGALARYGLSAAVPPGPWGLWTLLAINVLGCLLMGMLRPGPLGGTGFLGGFTSYSSYAVLINSAFSTAATMAVVLATPLLCVGAVFLGDHAGQTMRDRRAPSGADAPHRSSR